MENQIIRKSNYLMEASYMLSVVEQKIILFLTSSIKSEDEDFKEYQLRIKDFQESLGNNLCNYEDVIDIAGNLQEKTLHIVYPDEKGRRIRLQLNWFSSVKHTEGSGAINLRFDPNLKPFLLQLKSHFTKYRRINIAQLKSRYSIRIYELLKQYEKLGQRLFEYPNLRSVLGIPEDQYRQYTDFRKKVILVTQVELAKKTDISFDFEELRKGHRVGNIRFFIKSKGLKQAQLTKMETVQIIPILPELEPPKDENLENLEKLVAFLPGVYREKESIRKLLKTWLAKQSFDYVVRNILYTNEKSNAAKPGANLGKRSNYRVYLSKTLQNDFGLAFQEDMETKRQIEEEQRQKKEQLESQRQQEMQQLTKEREEIEQAIMFIKDLSPKALETLEEEALKRMPANLRLQINQNPAVKVQFNIFKRGVALELMGIKKAPETPEEKREMTAGDQQGSACKLII